MTFTPILGTVPQGGRTLQDVAAARVSVKKYLMIELITLDQLKLSKAARDRGSVRLVFFETSGSIGSDFKAVYDLHIRIEALSKVLAFFDIADVFQIIDESTVVALELHLEDLLKFQRALDTYNTELLGDSSNTTLTANIKAATSPISFKKLDEPKIYRSNAYYEKFGADYSVENLVSSRWVGWYVRAGDWRSSRA